MSAEIPDRALAFIILGAFAAVAQMENFPVYINRIEHNLDADGEVEAFTIVTFSGLRYRTTVTFEEQP